MFYSFPPLPIFIANDSFTVLCSTADSSYMQALDRSKIISNDRDLVSYETRKLELDRLP